MSYAQHTNVPAGTTKSQIEVMLVRRGATGFISGWKDNNAFIAFEFKGRAIRFLLPLPNRTNNLYTHSANGKLRSIDAQNTAWNQACNARWLVLKAKLEAIDTGIVSLEDEFLSHIQLPTGLTIGETIIPQLKASQPVTLLLPGTAA
jgi:hypothetical protein